MLVTGGSGFIGQNPIASALDADGVSRRLIVQHLKDRYERLTCYVGDITHYADVIKAMKECSAVVHLAAGLSSRINSKPWRDNENQCWRHNMCWMLQHNVVKHHSSIKRCSLWECNRLALRGRSRWRVHLALCCVEMVEWKASAWGSSTRIECNSTALFQCLWARSICQ